MMTKALLLIVLTNWTLPGRLTGMVEGIFRPPAPSPSPEARPTADVEAHVVHYTNQERRARGLRPLQADAQLSAISRLHSRDMLQQGYFSHVDPQGRGPADRVGQHRNLIGLSGENLWMIQGLEAGPPQQLARRMVRDWMNSPGHRENMLRPHLTHLGIGVVQQGRDLRATQLLVQTRAFSLAPLPERLQPGGSLAVSLQSFPSSAAAATRYDFVPVGTSPPVLSSRPLLQGRISAPAQPGLFRIRFYFPEGNLLHIYPGPVVAVGVNMLRE